VIVVLGLLIAFVMVVLFSNRATRACRWREDRSADRGGARLYRCATCGAEVRSAPGQPPRVCHAPKS